MKERINRDIPVPLYYQISNLLEERILEGIAKPGDYFGTEQEFQELFEVSRATIRKALERLETDELIYRITGKGIFVAPRKLKVELPQLLSFTEEMKLKGMTPGTVLVGADWVEPPSTAIQELCLSPGSQALVIRRVRSGDGIPIVYSECYLSPESGLTPDEDYSGSLYNLLESRTGRSVDIARHRIEATLAAGSVAEHLATPVGFPLIKFGRVAFDTNGAPLLYEIGYCRGDHYSYEIMLKRNKESP
ncbi:GntR family transcriptional regulator [Paenibacillus wynnii]|uniref:HTH gntR-type domain-containing protein n=1 Tax=Paenibacillus wynnii TaxID=268407 RepID=A0A098M834_9BACL|nr:GntR family transcriptional regulator [Paenibacillus wynnii]KGE18734.1 hypothetical protein PWYN_04635 [Paenibacillus wynnii]